MFEIKLLLKDTDSSPAWLEVISIEILNQFRLKVITSESLLAESEDYLIFNGKILEFCSKNGGHLQFNPIWFDFDQILDHYQEEFKRKSKKSELLYRAFNFKTNQNPVILDATCGTAKDALTLIYFGAKVIAFERNPVVYLLLRDAIARSTHLMGNLELHFGHASSYDRPVDMIYYDPMFPEKKKSALPSKEMQVFKYLVGPDSDQVMEAMRLKTKNPKRLVIKRPHEAPAILENPSMSYESKLLRLDCYL